MTIPRRVGGLLRLLTFATAIPFVTTPGTAHASIFSGGGEDHLVIDDEQDAFSIPNLGYKPGGDGVHVPERRQGVFHDLWHGLDWRPVESRLNRQANGVEELQDAVAGLANSSASAAVREWFSRHHATAELAMGSGADGYRTGSFDLLLPLVDTNEQLFFTQMGMRRSSLSTDDYRSIANVGLGVRRSVERWMLGMNTFYDRDITGRNSRLGLGAEAWTDYLKLSGNAYRRLSEDRDSVLSNSRERSATGWDLRAEAFLPEYPQLGSKLIYEQYYGSDVGLFGNTLSQKNPRSTTVGMSYTPIPLVSLSADYQRGQDGLSETFITVGLSFELGTPIEKQLSPRAVKSRRLLSNARYDLIARRNDVVLDYHRNAEGSIKIPTELHGVAGSVMSFPITVSGSSIQNVTWVGTAGPYATVYGGGANGGLRLPPYRAGSSNSYTLKAVGTDGAGNLVQSNPLQVYVDSLKLSVERSVSISALMGSTIVGFTATLRGPDGQPVPDSEIRWRVSGDATVMSKDVKTGRDGRAILEVASSSTQQVLITVEEPQGASAQLGTIIESNAALALDNRNPIAPGEAVETNI